MAFCINCGGQLVEGAKFCHACGNPVTGTTSEDRSQRQQEYVGKIFKCPNCGNIVNPSEAVCSSCGFQLSGKKAVSSAKDFQQQMMEIEKTRKKKKTFWPADALELDETDKQVLSLIKTYPIPNTIEDIVEFMHLAIANIDVKISKRTIWNSDTWSGTSPSKEFSNAWVAKMQQIYNKAELYFPNEPEFMHVKEVYFEMMKELKING